MAEQVGFGAALAWMNKGGRVTRAGWNGTGMYLYRIESITLTFGESITHRSFRDGDTLTLEPMVILRTATSEHIPWVCSQTDMYANDWEYLDCDDPE